MIENFKKTSSLRGPDSTSVPHVSRHNSRPMSPKDSSLKNTDSEMADLYSYSRPDQIQVQHLNLKLDVSFDQRTLNGTAELTLEESFTGDLILDTRDLAIHSVEYSNDLGEFHEAAYQLGAVDRLLGAPLTIQLPVHSRRVRIRYTTSENASGLQWLEPIQTAGKKYPFLFTQSEATHARSWIPLQDTPRVRMTFHASVRKPHYLKALMSASNNPEAYGESQPHFTMLNPIPAYLIALAVGDLDFRNLGRRTGVFAERSSIEPAARELEDLEEMLEAGEKLFGPYRWGRYDVLVLPPSFPVGGMENPCLTFTTPTIIAGDKSLLSLIVHEMAHSWSSNLVSNANWGNFWINEGFTVYMERRILEQLYGRERAEVEAVLGMRDLAGEFARLDLKDQVLAAHVDGPDPNAGYSQIPYEKGALFLRSIEELVGRPRFDQFLRQYFEEFAFKSITTSQFIEYLQKNLLPEHPEVSARLPIHEWVHGAGLPEGAALPQSDVLERVEQQAARWLRGALLLTHLQTSSWTTQEWLHFLKYVCNQMDASKMQELDRVFHLTKSRNAEIESQWLLMAVRNRYKPAYERLEQFLIVVGRRKYLKLLYGELAKTPEGRRWAESIYTRAAPNYHPIARDAVNSVLLDSDRLLAPKRHD